MKNSKIPWKERVEGIGTSSIKMKKKTKIGKKVKILSEKLRYS